MENTHSQSPSPEKDLLPPDAIMPPVTPVTEIGNLPFDTETAANTYMDAFTHFIETDLGNPRKFSEYTSRLEGDIEAGILPVSEGYQIMKAVAVASQRHIKGQEEEVQNLRVEANTDAVTGLGNRRALDVAVEHLADQPDKQVAIIDLTNQKAFNDILGYDRGTKNIQLAAKSLIEVLHFMGLSERVAFRMGGDEFAIIIPNDPKFTQEILSLVDIRYRHNQAELVQNSPEEAQGIMIEMRGDDPMPYIRGGYGLHYLRARFGVGRTLEEADQGVIAAKEKEKQDPAMGDSYRTV